MTPIQHPLGQLSLFLNSVIILINNLSRKNKSLISCCKYDTTACVIYINTTPDSK